MSAHTITFPYANSKLIEIYKYNLLFLFCSHGNKDVFSCLGIQLAVNFFLERGHVDITVFVPSWRKEQPRPDVPITGKEKGMHHVSEPIPAFQKESHSHKRGLFPLSYEMAKKRPVILEATFYVWFLCLVFNVRSQIIELEVWENPALILFV